MKATHVFALVCLPVLLAFPNSASPTARQQQPEAVTTQPKTTVALPVAAPTTTHVVLTRGPHRLELDLPLDGNVDATTADAIALIMRDPNSGRTRRIATGTLALLADVAVRFPGHDIQIVSAVRAEPDRSKAGIKHSKHWSGHAIDLIVEGVKLPEVRKARELADLLERIGAARRIATTRLARKV